MRQPAVAQRFLDPHRLQLAIPAPDDGGDARHDATVVVPTEDPELPFVTKSGGGDRGGRHLLLEQRQVGRVGRVLDDEFGQPARRLGQHAIALRRSRGSASEDLGLGGRELLVGQGAVGVQLPELLELVVVDRCTRLGGRRRCRGGGSVVCPASS